MKLLFLTLLCVMHACVCSAISTGLDIYLGIDGSGVAARTYCRDGVTPLPVACCLQPIWAGVNNAMDEVSPDSTQNFLGGDDWLSTDLNSSTQVGSDALKAGIVGPGRWDTRIVGGTEVSNRYYVRLFSAARVADAAYYGTTPLLRGDNPVPERFDLASFNVDHINPAYVIPLAVQGETELTAHPGAVPLAGTVTVGVGNNLLGNEGMQVIWTNTTTGAAGTFMVTASGDWSGNATVVSQGEGGVNSVDVYAVGKSARPGYPRSQVVTKTITVLAK